MVSYPFVSIRQYPPLEYDDWRQVQRRYRYRWNEHYHRDETTYIFMDGLIVVAPEKYTPFHNFTDYQIQF